MSVEPFLAQITPYAFSFAPRGWAQCNGQLLAINQNQALFSLLGTTYGGDGQVNFALPDLRGKVPFHWGSGMNLGQRGGEEAHTITQAELPGHTHLVSAADVPGTETSPVGNVWAQASTAAYNSAANTAMRPTTITSVGGSQPHENRSPYLVLNICIALQGIFPSRN